MSLSHCASVCAGTRCVMEIHIGILWQQSGWNTEKEQKAKSIFIHLICAPPPPKKVTFFPPRPLLIFTTQHPIRCCLLLCSSVSMATEQLGLIWYDSCAEGTVSRVFVCTCVFTHGTHTRSHPSELLVCCSLSFCIGEYSPDTNYTSRICTNSTFKCRRI